MSDEDTTLGAVEETVEDAATPEVEEKPESKGRDAAIAAERRKARAAEKKAAELQKKLDEAARKEAEAEGRWQEIAEEERKRADSLEQQIAEREKREAVTEAATRLRFKNPTIAHRLLSDDDLSDPEGALKRLAKSEPYLIADPPERTGAPVGGNADTQQDDPLANAGAGLLAAIEARRRR